MAVYFIQDSEGFVKIGRAQNIFKRLAALQTAHAKELTLIRDIQGGELEEWALHHEFAHLRVRGEWFKYTDDMMTFIPSELTRVALLKRAPKRQYGAVNVVRAAIKNSGVKQSEVARMMGYSPSSLSRKLSQSPDDSQRFTLDDLEKFIAVTGDTSPVLYLVEKYLTEHDRIAELEKELARLKKAAA